MHVRIGCTLILLTCFCLSVAVAANSDVVDAGDFWDSDDQVEPVRPIPVPEPEPVKQVLLTKTEPATDNNNKPKTPITRGSRSIWGSLAGRQGSYVVEAVFALLTAWFVAGIFTGKDANKKIVKAWSDTFLTEGGVLERNFAQLGIEDGKHNELVMRENSKKFKFWASGRRHCQASPAQGFDCPSQDNLELMEVPCAIRMKPPPPPPPPPPPFRNGWYSGRQSELKDLSQFLADRGQI